MEKLPLSPPDYCLYPGTTRDRRLLVDFLHRTYDSLFPDNNGFPHLSQTVESYFSWRSPLWWVVPEGDEDKSQPIAGLWLGNAVDQVTGDLHGHIFMLYVEPQHRRRGIATALMAQAQQWGEERGDRCLALQVFTHNQGAMKLYDTLGFTSHALLMRKTW